MDEEEGGNGSAGSGHSLSLLGSDEDLENQLPFDHADSDGSDLRSPNDSEEEAEELPMEQEASMMEEVRALIEYAMPSELGASPFQLGVAAPPHPIPAQAVDHHAGSYLAKAALLLPVAMDLYTVDRDPEVAKSRFSLPRAMCVLLSLLILLTCGAMHVVFEVYSGSMRHEILETANDAISLQSSAVDGMMYNHVTSERLKHVLGSVSKNLSDTILRPADQAVESLSAFLRSRHALNRSWDASRKEDQAEILYRIFVEFDTQWKIQDGPFRHDHVVASDAAPTNQLKSLSIISTSGHVLGMEGSSYTVSCPRSGPAVCGHCIGECKDLDVNAFTSQGQELVRRKVDVTSGLPVGRPLLEEPFNFSESPAFAAQEAAREAAGLLQKRWSKIYHRPEQAARLSWTAPIASCGSYACLKGVVAAEVVLDHLDELCRQSLPLMAQNGSIFVVNHVSPDAAQHGMLLAAAPHAEEVAATSRALMAKFKAWNADPLSSPQVLSFRKSKALKGQFVECGAHLITASEDDCLQAATASLELDPFTRWLLVAVLPETPRLTQSALAAIDLGEQSVNEARISSTVIVVLVGFIALLVGRVLAWSVTEPMLQLSLNFQQVDRFDGLLPDAEVLPKSFAIKDVSDVQQAFRKFLSGIRAFSRFIPEDVVTRIIFGDPRSVRPHVDSRSVTIMFTGIRDIIRMSFNEEQLLSVITRFHKTMTAIVEQYEGAVGEILDEGLLVYFNAPRRLVDHPVKACEAALAQRKAMAELRNELVEDGWLDPSDSCLRLGVGIHTGNVLVGCIGSTMKMKFGCIGDAMNLASRLKGICKYYDVDVMCSEETYLATTSLVCRKIDDLQVKGRAETTAVYEVMGPEQATGGILSPEASPQGPKPAPEVIGAGALTLPIQLGRKKGPPQFLTPEERGPPVLLTQLSRSPRSYPDSPVVMGRQIHSPDRTTRTTAGDRTTRTTGASWSAGASPWPAPSPESGGSEGYSRRHGRGCSSSSMSPAALEEVTTEQRALKKETEAALEAYQQSNPEKCVKICRKVLMSNPDDTVTRRLLEKALQHPGFPEITVMDEK